jgi:hypothetical protein
MASGIDAQPIFVPHLKGVDSTIDVGVDVSAQLELPGLHLGVDHAQLLLSIGFVDADGKPALQVLPPDLTFVRPSGMSAELDLPAVKGGGSLSRVDEQWRGALQATIGPVSITGLGILDTGDVKALLLLLAAEFNPAIQLSFGFTLVGVGGIVGINRRPNPERISAAVASGDLSKLLFPRDPVAEADRLLPVLNDCFEVEEGSFVVGPMLKMGWGTPTIIAATLGVLIADDAVTILGRIAVTLPFEALDLIHIEGTIVGRIDAHGLAIDASLANSHILNLPIEGDLKLRAQGGDQGFFAFSAGGFHPAFQPPAGMDGMRRIGTSISPGPMFNARLEAYLAVTSKSVQFGARVDLRAGIPGFNIAGHAAFDALFVFSPAFRFDTHFSASVSVECADFDVCSIGLDARLSGASPWRVRGHASISILFWDVDVDLPEITWGPNSDAALPPAQDPAAALGRELGSVAAWTATSQDVPHLVQLRPGLDHDQTAIHPLAAVGFRQHAVPLGTPLQRMDGVPLPAPVTLTVQRQGGGAIDATAFDQFVPRQFFDIADDAQQASGGYDTLPGGFDLAPAEHRIGPMAAAEETYETSVLGDEGVRDPSRRLLAGLLDGVHLAGHGAAPIVQPPALVTILDPSELALAGRSELVEKAIPAVGVAAGAATVGLGMGVASEVLHARGTADLQLVAAWELVRP